MRGTGAIVLVFLFISITIFSRMLEEVLSGSPIPSSISRPATSQHKSEPKLPRPMLKLPSIIHYVLTEDQINSREVFVIGDVHGCYDEQRKLVDLATESAKARNNKDVLIIYVGDLLNKGPESVKSLRMAMEMKSLCVRGNHEESAMLALQKYRQAMNEHYGSDPHEPVIIPEQYQWTLELTQDEIDWIMEMPMSISIPSYNICIVHAGIVPGVPLREQHLPNLLRMRDVIPLDEYEQHPNSNSNSPSHSPIYSASFKYTKFSQSWALVYSTMAATQKEHTLPMIIFGHDAPRRLQRFPFAVGLDSGCVYGGELSGVFLSNVSNVIKVAAARQYVKPSGLPGDM
mmetsp:Transcript_16590/g.29044  ORF Transcript_16590/g.29044 Transcript_16590/m.29044 type:complete len:344 (-) Transcript_16590:207-1238(-)